MLLGADTAKNWLQNTQQQLNNLKVKEPMWLWLKLMLLKTRPLDNNSKSMVSLILNFSLMENQVNIKEEEIQQL